MFKFVVILVAVLVPAGCQEFVWGYECHEDKCTKVPLNEGNFQKKALSLAVCRMICGNTIGTLWPKPTGRVNFSKCMVHINIGNIGFDVPTGVGAAALWKENEKRFKKQIDAKIPDVSLVRSEGMALYIRIRVRESEEKAAAKPRLTYDSDESYTLEIIKLYNKVLVNILANSFFGARHGLETLSQLIVYDEMRREVQVLEEVEIEDAPVYKHRGILLDTARNYFSVKSIKRTIDGMAMVKLNNFHWHITDSQSFPIVIKSHPDMHKLGAYSAQKIYTHKDIVDVVEYGRTRGVRVYPEFSGPSHVGAGWEYKNMTVCFNVQPWKAYCDGPPCGQLDPTIDALYDVLADIYKEMLELFDPDVFHIGGDEVFGKCWRSSDSIQKWMCGQGWGQSYGDFMKLWGHFQTKALAAMDSVSKNRKLQIIVNSSPMTRVPHIDRYLNKDRYIIWESSTNPVDTLNRGFKVIISNEVLYFDCGGANYVTDGTIWCSPYFGWQKVYENRLDNIASSHINLVLGAEASVWSEQLEEQTMDNSIWPKASALAERLWSNPTTDWRLASSRVLLHRERLKENGIAAGSIGPEYCFQNQDFCLLT